MKRLTAPLIAFLVIICNCAYLTHPDDKTAQSGEEHVSTRSPTPEFSDLSIDESGSRPQMVIALVVKGESAICLSDKSRFPHGKALALYKRSDTFSLEKTHIDFKALSRTELSAFFPIKFSESKNALFLLSDDGNLSPQPVRTLYLRPWNTSVSDDKLFFDGLRIGDQRSFSIGDNVYKLRVSTGPSSQAGSVAVLVLENQEQKQMIWYGTIFDKEDEVGELNWVGDLDGDERLDILFRYFERNGGGSVDLLLLSSYAKQGNLVGPAAFSFARDCH